MDTRHPFAPPAPARSAPARLVAVAAVVLAASLLLTAGPAPAQAPPGDDGELTRLLRHPDVHGDTIAFSYAGDLWVVATEGGVARRLTAHEGLELFPKFSPDGRWIAFTGDYGGTRQVHVIPAEGGVPRQLTYRNDVGNLPPRGGIDNRVLGWTPDGERVIFGAHRLPWSDRWEVPYAVPFEGGMEEPLGVPQGSAADLAADGRTVAYTPLTREFRTWKRYHGGTAQDVWTFDLEDGSARRLTDYDGTDNQPQWLDGTIYFTSDRTGGKLNLYALDLEGDPDGDPEGDGEPRQVTHHETWDVLWPSAGPGGVVYEAGGWIHRYDPGSGESARVPIRVYGDFEGRLPRFASVADDVQTAGVSPSGARALFGARGDVFTVPAEKGEARNLTRSQGVRERDPAWSPDGRRVAYWSDRTGEYELYVRPADGSGEERRLTHDGADEPTWRHAPRWSPDGTKLAFGDRDARLRVVDAETGEATTVDRGVLGDITDHRWSPDGRWLAYTKVGSSRLPSVWVHDLESGATHQLTGDDTAEAEPVWDPEGRYLYFLSNRSFNLTFSAFEFDYVYTEPTRVYVGLLTDDAPPVLLPETDEEPVEDEPPGVGDGGETDEAAGSGSAGGTDGGVDSADDDGPVRVRLDPEEFESRVRAIPGPAGSYRSLAAVASGVLYMEGQGGETKLQLFDLDAEEEKTVLEGVQSYELAAGGETLLYTAFGPNGPTYGIAPAKPGQKAGEGELDLAGLEMRIDPPAEWRQHFVDGWRILRDWFYDPGMHGLDWQAMREKYEPLVDHLAHRADLDYVLGELGGELSAGHVYVQSSDDWQAERREGALLGAEVADDPSGYFRITEIFPGENWRDGARSPLTEPGVDVDEGDLVLAVDGVSTRTVENFFELLQGKADRVVTLTVASDPEGEAHEERVRPVTRETDLRYLAWVESRRRYVEERAGDRIGYIHLPNTAAEGTRELHRGFYAQAHKDALILDDRYNGGGFIPDGMIELLDRRLLSYWARRSVEPSTTPGFVHRGPKAALANGYAGSGGDAFPWYFQREDLGPVIGTRTWGGLIGISGNPPLADGGVVLAPNFRFVTPEGEWAVEGEGVEPDIRVVDRPDLEAQGIDPSLDKAIEVLLDALEEDAPGSLTVPEPPRM
ncbi:MAG: PDZ domain-containing protein [Thermoanaerobaculia bacterium]